MADSDDELLEQWYVALYEEDCNRIMELLRVLPTLWKQGWESDSSRTVGGSRLNYWMPRTEGPWMGRTALHVGARRGCTELLARVLKLCGDERKMEGEDRKGKKIVGSPLLSSTVGVAVSRSLENLLLAKDGEYKLDAIGMAAVNGNVDVLTTLLSASLECEPAVRPYNIRDARKISQRREMDEEEERKKKREEHAALKGELQKVTKEVTVKFSDDPVFTEILSWYRKHRDFNFLPQDVYLFHFLQTDLGPHHLFSRDQIVQTCTAAQAAILEKSTPELRCFLWELQDGQGRPPLHIAVDEDESNSTLYRGFLLLCRWLTRENKEIVNALDGGGRTAVHRAVALGRTNAVSKVMRGNMRFPPEARSRALPYSLAGSDESEEEPFSAPPELVQLAQHALLYSMSTSQQSSAWDSLRSKCGFYLDVNHLSETNGFHGNEVPEGRYSKILGTAIIHKRGEFIKELRELTEIPANHIQPPHKHFVNNLFLTDNDFVDIELIPARKHFVNNLLREPFYMFVPRPGYTDIKQADITQLRFTCLELAVMVGDERTLEVLLQHVKFPPEKEIFGHFGFLVGDQRRINSESPFTALHLAAGSGKYDILKLLVDREHCDLYVEDHEGNSALHHATKESVVEFYPRLFDYVNCEQILGTQEDREKNVKECWERKHLANDDFISDREGCIDLLVQLGCNIFRKNKDKQPPYPGSHMSPKFRKWSLDRRTQVFEVEKNILTEAANAISVIGTLVATASYVGPLQPPLGYGENPYQLQLQVVWVKIFIVCDTMSFYLAMTAVILSLIPSLPIPQQPMIDELRRTRKMVTLATMVLLPSIIFVIIAFASSSIAVIQTHRTVWNYGVLTIATASIGGLICSVAILLFYIRTLAFRGILVRYPDISKSLKKLYDFTSF